MKGETELRLNSILCKMILQINIFIFNQDLFSTKRLEVKRSTTSSHINLDNFIRRFIVAVLKIEIFIVVDTNYVFFSAILNDRLCVKILNNTEHLLVTTHYVCLFAH